MSDHHLKHKTSLGSISDIVKDLRMALSFLSFRRKVQLVLLLILQIIGGFVEIVSLGALLPFLSAISNAGDLLVKPQAQSILQLLNIHSEADLIFCASAAFIGAFICANVFKIYLFWLQNKMTVSLGCDINQLFFKRVLHQDFEFHLNTNSSALISRTFTDLGAIQRCIAATMMISTQAIAITFITLAIVWYDPVAASIIFSSVLLIYLAIAHINRGKMVKNGRVVSDKRAQTVHILQVALGGIRDVLLNSSQPEYMNKYAKVDRAFRTASRNIQFLSVLPRYLIEIVGVVILVITAAYYTTSQDGVFGTLPLIGGLAMAIVRILPAAQIAYNSYASIQSSHVSFKRALDILTLQDQVTAADSSTQSLDFKHNIHLRDVWFRFRNFESDNPYSDWILKGVNLSIPANQTVAFVGKTGSGKTTISDVIAGLLVPEKGTISIDDIPLSHDTLGSWKKKIACVPQSIFLIDATIKENVAFGESEHAIDLERVKHVCRLAQIDDLIESRPHQYDEIIGENGLKLSGGQRQRIGIARALYKNPSVLILDEATSALDNKTESSVMDTISSLHGEQTIIIIAHRLETIKKADHIFEIQDGTVIAEGTYEALLERSPSFREIAQSHQDS